MARCTAVLCSDTKPNIPIPSNRQREIRPIPSRAPQQERGAHYFLRRGRRDNQRPPWIHLPEPRLIVKARRFATTLDTVLVEVNTDGAATADSTATGGAATGAV